jgi:AbiV family abortive infection protein
MYDNDKTLLLELVRGAELTFQNAEQLFSEAVLLRKNGHLNRALFLHQISMEECAKIDILGAWATNLMSSGVVDLARLTKAIRNHKAKNYTNAYGEAIRC